MTDIKAAADLPEGSVDADGVDSPHPKAFRILYDAFRELDCTTALDPEDRDDCASVADEAVRVLMDAGLLRHGYGSEEQS